MAPLGFIPDWQFSGDPAENPYANQFVSMPEGMYQAGVFSSQPNLGGTGGLGFFGKLANKIKSSVKPVRKDLREGLKCLNCPEQFSGMKATLGFVMQDEGDPPVGVPWGMIKEGPMVFNRNVEYLRTGNFEQGTPLGFSFDNPLEASWMWTHRKAIVLTGVGIVGLAALSLLGAFGR